MIGNEQVTVRASDLPTAGSHAGESLRTAHLVQQLPVYVQQTRSIGIFTDKMRLPKLVIQRLSVQKVSLNRDAKHCPPFSSIQLPHNARVQNLALTKMLRGAGRPGNPGRIRIRQVDAAREPGYECMNR